MTEAQAATHALANLTGQAFGFFQVHQQGPRSRQKCLARCGKSRLACSALEQQGVEV
ncbi:hypothetical protein D9M71_666450 [compost metagenome]